jgi:hypothetical protein
MTLITFYDSHLEPGEKKREEKEEMGKKRGRRDPIPFLRKMENCRS